MLMLQTHPQLVPPPLHTVHSRLCLRRHRAIRRDEPVLLSSRLLANTSMEPSSDVTSHDPGAHAPNARPYALSPLHTNRNPTKPPNMIRHISCGPTLTGQAVSIYYLSASRE